MKLRAIHLKGHAGLGDMTVEFRTGGLIDDGCWLIGGCGAGKSLLFDAAAMCWGASVRSGRSSGELVGCRVRVDFEVGGEIGICQAEGDRVTGSPLLRERADFVGHSHLLLKYGRERFSSTVWATGSRTSGSVESLMPILSDLVNIPVRDSVILIDDFDMGLDASDQKLVWSYLWRHHRAAGNQLIVSGRRGLGLCREISLSIKNNPIELALNGLKKR